MIQFFLETTAFKLGIIALLGFIAFAAAANQRYRRFRSHLVPKVYLLIEIICMGLLLGLPLAYWVGGDIHWKWAALISGQSLFFVMIIKLSNLRVASRKWTHVGSNKRRISNRRKHFGLAVSLFFLLIFVGIGIFWQQSIVSVLYKSDAISSKILAQLESERLTERLSGLKAIEQIFANLQSEGEDILGILAMYIRKNSPWKAIHPGLGTPKPPLLPDAVKVSTALPVDIQKAIDIIKQRTNEVLLAKGFGIDLHESNLQYADLTEAYLPNVKLWKANLHGARLDNAYLIKSDLWEANLSEVRALQANLGSSDFWKANLEGAILEQAHMVQARLGMANLKRANFNQANIEMVDMQSADLESASLIGANLRGANLSRARLVSARCQRAEMKIANLRDANLNQADFRDTDLYSADLTNATFMGANLRNANLEKAILLGTNFKGSDLRGIHLKLLDPLCDARSLFSAKMDSPMISFINRECPRLMRP
jgi:uncharacterized protein YjbI with pentapeptide repeats